MADLGFNHRSGQSSVNASVPLMPLTLQERCEYLQGASMIFLLGTLLLALFMPDPLIAPGAEALFVFGWVYLAGASSDDRLGCALFAGSVIVAAASLVAFALLILTSAPFGWLYLLFLGPYVPAVYAPIVTAHAVLFVYLDVRFAVGRTRPSVMIGVGGIALVAVAIAGLLSGAPDPGGSVFFLPIGYALVTFGAWQQARRLRSPVGPRLGS